MNVSSCCYVTGLLDICIGKQLHNCTYQSAQKVKKIIIHYTYTFYIIILYIITVLMLSFYRICWILVGYIEMYKNFLYWISGPNGTMGHTFWHCIALENSVKSVKIWMIWKHTTIIFIAPVCLLGKFPFLLCLFCPYFTALPHQSENIWGTSHTSLA